MHVIVLVGGELEQHLSETWKESAEQGRWCVLGYAMVWAGSWGYGEDLGPGSALARMLVLSSLVSSGARGLGKRSSWSQWLQLLWLIILAMCC